MHKTTITLLINDIISIITYNEKLVLNILDSYHPQDPHASINAAIIENIMRIIIIVIQNKVFTILLFGQFILAVIITIIDARSPIIEPDRKNDSKHIM